MKSRISIESLSLRSGRRSACKLFLMRLGRMRRRSFFATQDHALAVRDLINQFKKSTDPNYCVRSNR